MTGCPDTIRYPLGLESLIPAVGSYYPGTKWTSSAGLFICREEQSPFVFSIGFTLGICFRKRWVLLLKSPYSLSDLGEPRVPGSAAAVWMSQASLFLSSLLTSVAPRRNRHAYFVPWCYFENMVINYMVCGQAFSLWALHWKCEALRSWKTLSWYSPGRAGHRSLAYYFRNIVPWSYQILSVGGTLSSTWKLVSLQMILLTNKGFSSRLSSYSPRLSCSCPAFYQGFWHYSLRGHGCKGSQALKIFVRLAVCKLVWLLHCCTVSSDFTGLAKLCTGWPAVLVPHSLSVTSPLGST